MEDKQVSSPELSATIFAKQLTMSTKNMFQLLVDTGLIRWNGENWDLTPIGKSKGGIYRQSREHGRYMSGLHQLSQNLMIHKESKDKILLRRRLSVTDMKSPQRESIRYFPSLVG